MPEPVEKAHEPADGDDSRERVMAVAELQEELTVAAAAPGRRRLLRLEELLLFRAAQSRRA